MTAFMVSPLVVTSVGGGGGVRYDKTINGPNRFSLKKRIVRGRGLLGLFRHIKCFNKLNLIIPIYTIISASLAHSHPPFPPCPTLPVYSASVTNTHTLLGFTITAHYERDMAIWYHNHSAK